MAFQPSGVYTFVGKFLFTNFKTEGRDIHSLGRDYYLAMVLKLPTTSLRYNGRNIPGH